MPAPGREPSMEDILASIKKVIAEEKELRTAVRPADVVEDEPLPEEATEADEEDVLELQDEVLELDQPLPPVDLGPPLLDENAAETTRHQLEQLSTVAASAPPPPTVNPLEEMVRDMLRPVLKDWVDEHLPRIVEEHVKREISRITGRKL
jgi:cell pole-organizing protein PopZ